MTHTWSDTVTNLGETGGGSGVSRSANPSSQASSGAPGPLRLNQLCPVSLVCFHEDVLTVSWFLYLIASELDYPTMMSALTTQGIKHSPQREELILESDMNNHDSRTQI